MTGKSRSQMAGLWSLVGHWQVLSPLGHHPLLTPQPQAPSVRLNDQHDLNAANRSESAIVAGGSQRVRHRGSSNSEHASDPITRGSVSSTRVVRE